MKYYKKSESIINRTQIARIKQIYTAVPICNIRIIRVL